MLTDSNFQRFFFRLILLSSTQNKENKKTKTNALRKTKRKSSPMKRCNITQTKNRTVLAFSFCLLLVTECPLVAVVSALSFCGPHTDLFINIEVGNLHPHLEIHSCICALHATAMLQRQLFTCSTLPSVPTDSMIQRIIC